MTSGVDLIITTYNRRELARRAVKNALEQDCPGLSITVVDDGGTDGTTEALRRAFGDRIRIVRQENRGLSAARNRGLEATSSPFVSFLDDDDLLLPGMLERQRGQLDSDPALGFCYCSGYQIKAWRTKPERSQGGPHGRVLGDLLHRNLGPVHAFMARRDALLRAGTFDESLSSVEDWDLWLRLARISLCGYDPTPGFVYYVTETNMSRNHENMLAQTLLVYDRHAAAWEGPERTKREYRAGHLVKFVRRFFDSGNERRATEVFRDALRLSCRSLRLLPSRYLRRYLEVDRGWFLGNAPSFRGEDAAPRSTRIGNSVRAAFRQIRVGDVSGGRTVLVSLLPVPRSGRQGFGRVS